MKCLRITGNARTKNYNVVIMGENEMKAQEDTHDTVMQVLRLKLRWDIIDEQTAEGTFFDYSCPIKF